MEKPTTFQKCENIKHSLLARAAEALSYKTWSDEFRLENIRNISESIERWEAKYKTSFKINPNDLTADEMKELGFGIWSDKNPIRLIPLWLYPFLADKFESESISGSKHTTLAEVDNDHRGGYLAYGVIPKS